MRWGMWCGVKWCNFWMVPLPQCADEWCMVSSVTCHYMLSLSLSLYPVAAWFWGVSVLCCSNVTRSGCDIRRLECEATLCLVGVWVRTNVCMHACMCVWNQEQAWFSAWMMILTSHVSSSGQDVSLFATVPVYLCIFITSLRDCRVPPER